MGQMKDHVGPGLDRNVPTICVLFGTLSKTSQKFCSPHVVVAERNDYLTKYENSDIGGGCPDKT